MVGFDTVCEKHAVIGDSCWPWRNLKTWSRTGATHLLRWFNIGTVPHADGQSVDGAIRDGCNADAVR